MLELSWLRTLEGWRERLTALSSQPPTNVWAELVALAGYKLGFLETIRLDKILQKHFGAHPPEGYAFKEVRLAILGSSTIDHLLPGLRVAGLRRGLWITTYATDYGTYLQEVLDKKSRLYAFRPNTILFAFDVFHVFGNHPPLLDREAADAALEAALAKIRDVWRHVRKHSDGVLLQQAVLPLSPAILGNNEHRLCGSSRRLVALLNERLRPMADKEGVDIVGLDDYVAQDGLEAWHDRTYWFKAKQEISPASAHVYGDLVMRLVAARQGRSFKCLVLDLDNTLWGGVVGDDGVEGIVLGQGSPMGEAFLAMQRYARDLASRGVILAVCSKNDEANALEPFARHPDMILKRADIACFMANWNDKAANLREIAARLQIGLDALVFVDDNPFERAIVRRELPMVAVPEMPEDPVLYVPCLANAGYFEAATLTPEDVARGRHYQDNAQREALKDSATDIEGYLRSLQMELHWGPFDALGLSRIHQLINKTNQFNLTTRRMNEAEVAALKDDPTAITLQVRLTDTFGDNGMIGIAIGKITPDRDVRIETWLMSCRVLGRGVEEAMMNLLAAEASRIGGRRLIGLYHPTAKNGMVRDHYAKLGFTAMENPAAAPESSAWVFPLDSFTPRDVSMTLKRMP